MNKGFTLIELLAVIVILAVLTYLTSISVANVIRTSKGKLNDVQTKIIRDAAEAWLTDNLDLVPDTTTSCLIVTLGDLIDYGIISDVKDLNKLENLSHDIVIKVTVTNTTKYTFLVNATEYDDCIVAYE